MICYLLNEIENRNLYIHCLLHLSASSDHKGTLEDLHGSQTWWTCLSLLSKQVSSLSPKIPQIKQEQQEAGEESKHKAEQEDGGADHLRNVTKALQVSDNESTRSLWLLETSQRVQRSSKFANLTLNITVCQRVNRREINSQTKD